MLEVARTGDKRISLSGTIDGSEDFDSLLGGLAQGTAIDCSGVLQINSTGIKAWILFFGDPAKKSWALRFVGFSATLVDQLNMLRNFAGCASVESIQVPFRCDPCAVTFYDVRPVAMLSVKTAEKLRAACPRCRKPARFDELPSDYLSFTGR